MSVQLIPDDIMEAAGELITRLFCDENTAQDEEGNAVFVARKCQAMVAAALFAERQKHDHPTSPDLQAEAERVFADVQRAVLVEDAKQVIAKALQAARADECRLMQGALDLAVSRGCSHCDASIAKARKVAGRSA